jgi:hypothetical protein
MSVTNPLVFAAITAEVNAAASCSQLQTIVTRAIQPILEAQTQATAQLAIITPMLALLTAPSANPTAIVTYLQTLITAYLTPQLVPAVTLAAQLTATITELATLTSAITSKASSFTGCSITIPT